MPDCRLLAGAILNLLELRCHGWQNEQGCTGHADIQWRPSGPDGVETTIGGAIGYRLIPVTEFAFWSKDGIASPRVHKPPQDNE